MTRSRPAYNIHAGGVARLITLLGLIGDKALFTNEVLRANVGKTNCHNSKSEAASQLNTE